jgi:hypothetical protein
MTDYGFAPVLVSLCVLGLSLASGANLKDWQDVVSLVNNIRYLSPTVIVKYCGLRCVLYCL